jgi:hypothetical protein
MGIMTDFKGRFELDKPLDANHIAYLSAFNKTRRMKWSVSAIQERPDPIREAVLLPIGPEGAYYVGGETRIIWEAGDPAIDDYNNPPQGQPGLWCLWSPTDAGKSIAWDGGDKFYFYVEWLHYLIDHFIRNWGYEITGRVTWESEVINHWSEEQQEDEPCISRGEIIVESNVITVNQEIIWINESEE